MSTPLLHYKPKFNRHPARIKLSNFVTRLQHYMADGDQSSVEYMLKNFKVENDSVVIIYRSEFQHAPTVTKHL